MCVDYRHDIGTLLIDRIMHSPLARCARLGHAVIGYELYLLAFVKIRTALCDVKAAVRADTHVSEVAADETLVKESLSDILEFFSNCHICAKN